MWVKLLMIFEYALLDFKFLLSYNLVADQGELFSVVIGIDC